jgi:hypothetical protein
MADLVNAMTNTSKPIIWKELEAIHARGEPDEWNLRKLSHLKAPPSRLYETTSWSWTEASWTGMKFVTAFVSA